MEIRTERSADRDSVREVNLEAFGRPDEARLVNALREDPAFIPELSLVAVLDDRVAGHLLMTAASLDTGPAVLALAPMAVRPSLQRGGIGSALVKEAVRRARDTDFPLIVVLGHAEYYPRFGFRPGRKLGISAPLDVPQEAWMALPLPAWKPGYQGTVRYPSPFRIA